MARLRTARATSAGGVVVSFERERPSLVVGMRRRARDAVTWTLPKGTPDPGETVEQTAHYFLMEPTGGDLAKHDHEFERVRWVPFDEAGELLSFPTERELVATAHDRISAPGGAFPARGVTAPT